jgi:hypothetical protein
MKEMQKVAARAAAALKEGPMFCMEMLCDLHASEVVECSERV